MSVNHNSSAYANKYHNMQFVHKLKINNREISKCYKPMQIKKILIWFSLSMESGYGNVVMLFLVSIVFLYFYELSIHYQHN